MKSNEEKKELKAQYKEREVIGGVYTIKNELNNKILLGSAADLKIIQNRFEFSRKTGSCVYPVLQKDWDSQNGEQFLLEILETLEKGENQTETEYKADINALKELWSEKLAGEDMY